MLGPYNTSDSPITIVIVALIVIVVPLLSPYCYYCVSQKPTIVIVVPSYYYCYVALIILSPLRLLYIERRFFHLYHPRTVHLCNVKEVAPSKRLNLKSLIYIFFYFVSSLHNTQKGNLVQTRYGGIFQDNEGQDLFLHANSCGINRNNVVELFMLQT